MRPKKEIFEIVKKLEGLQTIESTMKILKVKRKTAINYISKLRKKGFLEYFSAGRNKRVYKISPIKSKLKGDNLYDIVNKYSKIKVNEPYRHILHDKKLRVEEALVLSLKSQNFKLILSSLNLFNHIEKWSLLNRIAKKHKLQRQVGALYDIARLFIKIKRMDKRTRKSMLKGEGSRYIYDRIKTKDFFDIAKKWKVEIPFKKNDLIRLKTG